jgi:hypothetical protein
VSDPAITAEARIAESLEKFQANWTRMLDPDTSSTDQAASIQHAILFFTYAVLLSEIASFDPDRADWLAGWIDDQLEDGGAGEVVYAWRQGTKPDVLVGQESALDEARRELATTREELAEIAAEIDDRQVVAPGRVLLLVKQALAEADQDTTKVEGPVMACAYSFTGGNAASEFLLHHEVHHGIDRRSTRETLALQMAEASSEWDEATGDEPTSSDYFDFVAARLIEGWGTATQPTPEERASTALSECSSPSTCGRR